MPKVAIRFSLGCGIVQKPINGQHEAQARCRGLRKSKGFCLSSDAKAWADKVEHTVRHCAKGRCPDWFNLAPQPLCR